LEVLMPHRPLSEATHADRRKIGRTTVERRNVRTRLEGLWTAAERERFIRALREERRDAEAVTIQAGSCQAARRDKTG
jgi:hypothetical protein